MQNVKMLPPVSRETLIKWARDQVELENARLKDPTRHPLINTLFSKEFIEGRKAAFEKVIRVFGPEEG
jgi:hypothetical protein